MFETIAPSQWRAFADAVLGCHLAIAAFIVFGQLAIILGGVFGIRAVRNRSFRIAHLALIVFVASETLLGYLCPLTHLEQYFRFRAGQQTYSESFTQHWLAPLLFFDAPWWVFAALHSLAALVVLLSWWLVPPTWSKPDSGSAKV